jgi:FlaA1/EpsC-like NDP-sugar epimerase
LVLIFKPLFFSFFQLYRAIWRYTSLRTLYSIVLSSTLFSLFLTFFVFHWRLSFPRSIIFIDWFLTVFLVGGVRIGARALYEFKSGKSNTIFSALLKKDIKPVIIVGAGDAGETIAKEMLRRPQNGYFPVGFVDDSLDKQGATIHGIKVLGTRKDLPKLIERTGAEEVIIAMPSANLGVIRDFAEICDECGVRCKTLPPVSELISGKIELSMVRDVEVDDLLSRPPLKISISKDRNYIVGKVVLITGAGGSIGSELCRQLSRLNPSKLILLDHSESNLFDIEQEFLYSKEATNLESFLGDLKDKEKLRAIFESYKPEIVFHAAAYKHVPLMELNPEEALANNLFGTKNVSELSVEFETKLFVFISTDKAVNPKGAMGASKALAERLVRYYNDFGVTRFIIVRFGNVLGSRGSVLEIFKKQIREGGPVTVTHPEMSRYFMTIEEAVKLIIEAGSIAKEGEIFVLDMGEPIKIMELAENMIRLSGFKPGVEIPIEIIGLRPGEKLEEELYAKEERLESTSHTKIFKIVSDDKVYMKDIENILSELEKLVKVRNREGIRKKLAEIFPSYCGIANITSGKC